MTFAKRSETRYWVFALLAWIICIIAVTFSGSATMNQGFVTGERIALTGLIIASFFAFLLIRPLATTLFYHFPLIALPAALLIIYWFAATIFLFLGDYSETNPLVAFPIQLMNLRLGALELIPENATLLDYFARLLSPYGLTGGSLAWLSGILLSLTWNGFKNYKAVSAWFISVTLVVVAVVIFQTPLTNDNRAAAFGVASLIILIVSSFLPPLAGRLHTRFPWLSLPAAFVFVVVLAQGVWYALFLDNGCNQSETYLAFIPCSLSGLWGSLSAADQTLADVVAGFWPFWLLGGTLAWLLGITVQVTREGLHTIALWFLRHRLLMVVLWLILFIGPVYFMAEPGAFQQQFSEFTPAVYWYSWLTGLTLLLGLYMYNIYRRAGRNHDISPGYFLRLNWRTPQLLEQLLGNDRSSYKALRFRLEEVSPLARLLFMIFPPYETIHKNNILEKLAAMRLMPDHAQVTAALESLVAQHLLQKEDQAYQYPQPQLATIYQQTLKKRRQELIALAREQSPAYTETIRFLRKMKFEVTDKWNDTLSVEATAPALKERLGKRILLRIMGDVPLKGDDVTRLAEKAKQVFRAENGRQHQHVAFVIVSQPPEAGAQAQITALRLNENFVIIPFNRTKLADMMATEFKAILDDYLDPTHAEVIRFFIKSDFDVSEESGNTLILRPNNQNWRDKLGVEVVAQIMCDQPIYSQNIQTVTAVARKAYGENTSLRKRAAFVIVSQPPNAGARAHMYATRFEEGFIIVPLSRRRLHAALVENQSIAELDRILDEYLSEQSDLYDRRVPVRDEDFFGRLQVIEELQSYLNRNQPIGIFALNKMGKTSLVRTLAERLTDRAVNVIDLQALSKTGKSLYKTIVRGLSQDMGNKWPDTTIPPLQWLSNTSFPDPLAALSHDLTALHDALATQTNDPRMVIFIDEIDLLIPGPHQNRSTGFSDYSDVLSSLRGISQQGLPLTIVVVGINAHINREGELAGELNALFQIFYEMFLPPMTKDECNQMIVDIGQQMGLEYTQEALDCVYRASGGHPFLARQLCSLAWDNIGRAGRRSRIVTLDETEIQRAVDAFIDDSRASYLEDLWRTRLKEDEKSVAVGLAQAEEPRTLQTGKRQTLNSLSERHIITGKGNSYRLNFELFRHWIRAYVLDLDE